MVAQKNPNSLANLRPPKKGEVRNPNGRKKGVKNVKTTLKKFLDAKIDFKNPLTKKNETATAYDIVAIRLVVKAMNGDLKAMKELYDRLEGSVNKSEMNIINQVNANGNNHKDSDEQIAERRRLVDDFHRLVGRNGDSV